MNYEDFYQSAQSLEKGIKDKLQNIQKSYKNIDRNTEKGDLKSLAKDLVQMRGLIDELEDVTAELQELADGFDTKEYVDSGDFARQIISYCQQYSVDIKGDFPNYEIFPFNVKIDAENQDLYVNRKKLQCLRPLSFVKDIKLSREKYLKASFNINVFLYELSLAYDMAILKKGSKDNNFRKEPDLLLVELYEYMVPTQRARKEYDLQNYALDLAKLYSSDAEDVRDGRKFVFGPSRNIKKQIRILDQNGSEQFLGTIRFYKADSQSGE